MSATAWRMRQIKFQEQGLSKMDKFINRLNYDWEFHTLEEGVEDYVKHLENENCEHRT